MKINKILSLESRQRKTHVKKNEIIKNCILSLWRPKFHSILGIRCCLVCPGILDEKNFLLENALGTANIAFITLSTKVSFFIRKIQCRFEKLYKNPSIVGSRSKLKAKIESPSKMLN